MYPQIYHLEAGLIILALLAIIRGDLVLLIIAELLLFGFRYFSLMRRLSSLLVHALGGMTGVGEASVFTYD